MKKTKRLLALVLAMMMAFSLLAMPAMAAGDDEGIMPLYEESTCPKHGVMERVSITTSKKTDEVMHNGTLHNHTTTTTKYTYACGYTHTVTSTHCDGPVK